MEREALAALEKRVSELRVIAAEKAVLARALADDEPPRWHAEISTAILALVVFAVFMLGREAGIFTAKGEACPGIGWQYAWVSYATDGYDVTIDTNGDVWRKERWAKRVDPAPVRAVVDQLARGCFLERQPPYTPVDGAPWGTITLRAGARVVRYAYIRNGPLPLCAGNVDVATIEKAIRKIADNE